MKTHLINPLNPACPPELLTEVQSFVLSDHDREILEAAAKDFPCADHALHEDLIAFACMVERKLPLNLKTKLYSLAMNPYGEAFAVIGNCPNQLDSFSSDYFLLATAIAMGCRAVPQLNEADEQIIQRIKPKKEFAASQTSSSYAEMLRWHGDDPGSGKHRVAWTIPFIKTCPMDGPDTLMSDMKKVCASLRQSGQQDLIKLARQNKVVGLFPDSQRGEETESYQGTVQPIISGPEGCEYITADFLGKTLRIHEDNPEPDHVVWEVLEEIREHIEYCAVSVQLSASDMALLGNRRGFHSRGAFNPDYDPTIDVPRVINRVHLSRDPWISREVLGHLV